VGYYGISTAFFMGSSSFMYAATLFVNLIKGLGVSALWSWRIVFTVFAAIGLTCVLLGSTAFKETDYVQGSAKPKESLLTSARSIFSNKSFLTFFASGRPILFPDITYSFYDVWADLFRIPYETKPLSESFEIVNRDYYAENGGIIFPNPNAPTGVLKKLDEVEDIVRRNRDVVVIVDEAYIDFADGKDGEIPADSALNLTDRYENLLVVQTFSKSRALAGMRIGFAIGSKKLIRYLNDAKYSFNSYTMDQTSIAAGVAAVGDHEYFKQCLGKIKATRNRTQTALRELGFSFHPSQSNFLFVTHEKVQARELFAALRKANIIVRYFDKPRIDNYLRITIGTDEQMDALTAFLKEYLSRQS
jgi:histidinol-phosphate aminotransferase